MHQKMRAVSIFLVVVVVVGVASVCWASVTNFNNNNQHFGHFFTTNHGVSIRVDPFAQFTNSGELNSSQSYLISPSFFRLSTVSKQPCF